MTSSRFTSETAREMAQRSAEARRRKAQERAEREARIGEVIQLRDGREVPRGSLSELALAVVHEMARKLIDGEVPIRTAGDAAKAAEVFHKVLRLEKGLATSIETMSAAEKMQTIRELAEAARARRADAFGGTRV